MKKAKVLVFLLLMLALSVNSVHGWSLASETSVERKHLVVKVLQNPDKSTIKCHDEYYNVYILPKSDDTIIDDNVTLESEEIVVVDFELVEEVPTKTISIKKFYLDTEVYSYDESERALEIGSYALGITTLILPEGIDGASCVNKIMRFEIEGIEQHGFHNKLKAVSVSDVQVITGKIIETNRNELSIQVSGRIIEKRLYEPYVQEEVDMDILRVQIDDDTIHFSALNPASTVLVILPMSYTIGQKEPVNALAIWDVHG